MAVTRSISFTIYYEIEKHPTPSDGSSSPTKCAPPTYPWNWSATSQGDYTCRRNAVNGLRRNVPRCRNGRLYKFPIRSVRPSVIVLSLSPSMERRRSKLHRHYYDPKRVGSLRWRCRFTESSARRTGRRKMTVDAGRVHSSQTGEAPLQTPLRRGGRS